MGSDSTTTTTDATTPPSLDIRFAPNDEGWAYVANRFLSPVVIPDGVIATCVGADIAPTAVGTFWLYEGTFDVIRTVAHLRAYGYPAQPDHVLFLHGDCSCCCPAHPADTWPDACTPRGGHATANPRGALNSVSRVQASPRGALNAMAAAATASGAGAVARRSTVAPATGPADFGPRREGTGSIRISVLDTGFANADTQPAAFKQYSALLAGSDLVDAPDNSPKDSMLDSCAGHGTFIAGVITQLATGCSITVKKIVDSGTGAVAESAVSPAIDAVVNVEHPPHYLNLSFGGRSWENDMAALTAAVCAAQLKGVVVVASAGNDSDCRPVYPAALPGVVSVGAIGPNGPASFTNYGPWVRCCAPGVDIISTFFSNFNGGEPATAAGDPDAFTGWARWSGTSFSAPAVVAALAREQAATGCSPQQAVAQLVEAPQLIRLPNLGTVVNI